MSAASAALAAVRAAEISEASSNASGCPVRSELSTITALARAIPDWMFSGNEEIHFSPAAGLSPPR